MANRIYLVGGPTGIRLVDATTRQQAIAHVANSIINATVATQHELVELLSKGVVVESLKAPEQVELPHME